MARKGEPAAPRRASQTVRESLRASLRATEVHLTALELSQAVGVPHRQVAEHLEHLARGGETLDVLPARCLACAFVFRDRDRFAKPSRCPTCRSERIEPPRFRMANA
jgi:hypothetical protein